MYIEVVMDEINYVNVIVTFVKSDSYAYYVWMAYAEIRIYIFNYIEKSIPFLFFLLC